MYAEKIGIESGIAVPGETTTATTTTTATPGGIQWRPQVGTHADIA